MLLLLGSTQQSWSHLHLKYISYIANKRYFKSIACASGDKRYAKNYKVAPVAGNSISFSISGTRYTVLLYWGLEYSIGLTKEQIFGFRKESIGLQSNILGIHGILKPLICQDPRFFLAPYPCFLCFKVYNNSLPPWELSPNLQGH